jgi:DNA repair exonuclease SbcCD ATPase subunit
VDLGTIQYNVEANTSDIEKANTAVDNMAEHMDDAGKAADNLGKKVTNTGTAAAGATKGVEKASGAVSGFGSSAGRAGIQVQQFVGQIQGGQNAFVALSQQAADLGIVLGAPLVGVVVSLGAVLAGTLLPSLFNTGDEMKAISELTKELVKDFKDFNDEQKKIVSKGIAVSVSDLTKQMLDAAKEAGEAKVKLDDQSKKVLASYGGKLKLRAGEGIEAETAALVLAQEKVLSIQKQINDLNDPTKTDKKLKSLQDEAAITGLVGRAYWELKASQDGVADSRKEEYIAAGISLDKKKEEIKTAKELTQEAEREAKKREAASLKDQNAEKTRAGNIQKMISSMKEEADLYGDISKEAKTRYEIENGLIKAKTQEEKDALITQAKRIDQLNDEKALQEAIDAEITDREEKAKKSQEKTDKELQKRAESIADMINDGLMRGFESGKGIIENFRDTVENVFKTLVLRPSVEILTADLSKAVGGILGSVGKKDAATGITSGASGVLGKLGPYGAIAVAVGGSLISSWNAKQDEKFAKLESSYRQGIQSTGTVLGDANKKSESIANAIANLGDTASSTLDVNYDMRNSLLAIEEGIAGVAAGFARTVDTGKLTSGIKTGTVAQGGSALGAASLNSALAFVPGGLFIEAGLLVGHLLGGQVGGFIDSIVGSISQAISSKKTSVIDSGIKIIGTNLADILARGTIEAFTYADVKTTKKFLGITTSAKVKEQLDSLDSVFEAQFASVFSNAGKSLELASKSFGANFDASKLVVNTSNLSLKGLEGDALTKAIQDFFSSTLDNWAGVLVGGTDVLTKFQQVGEGAFETVVRLSSEFNTFSSYADKLNFNFNLVGLGAIEAVQNIADLSGGFDKLSGSLSNYYQNFFNDSERAAAGLSAIGDVLKTVGIETVPKTREAFRALVEDPSIDLASESGQKYFSTLMSLSGAFAQLVPVTKEMIDTTDYAAQAAKDAAQAAADEQQKLADIANERSGLESKLLELYGETTTIRLRETMALDESNRSLQRQIYDLQDEKAAAEEAASALAAHNQQLKDNASSALSALSRSTDAEKGRINSIVDGATKAKDALSKSIDAEKDKLSKAHDEKLSLIKEQQDAEKAAQEAINKARIDSLNDQKSALEDSVKGLQSLIGGINNAIGDMAIKSNALTSARRRAAEFEIETALRNARAGRLPAMDSLSGALGSLGGDQSSIFSSSADMVRANAITQNQLKAISDIAGTKLSKDQQLLDSVNAQVEAAKATTAVVSTKFDDQIALENDAYTKQIASLDAISTHAQSQFDLLTGIDTKTLSLSDAISKYNDSLLAADFTNAQDQLSKLDEINTNAKLQIDALNGIDTSILSLNDSFINFANAVNTATNGIQQPLLVKMQSLVDEVSALRSESAVYNESIAKNTGSTAASTKSLYKDGVTIIETVPA